MRPVTAGSLVLGFGLVDTLVATLLFAKGDQFEEIFGNVTSYSFTTSVFDLWSLCVLRFIFNTLILVLILAMKHRISKIVVGFRSFYIFAFLAVGLFSLVKLLGLSENIDDFRGLYFFWALFTWNLFISFACVALYVGVLMKVYPPPPEEKEKDKKSKTSKRDDEQPLLDGENSQNNETVEEEKEEDNKIVIIDEKSSTARIIIRLLRYWRYEWRWLSVGFFFMTLYSAAKIFVPFYVGRVVSDVIDSHSPEALHHSVLMTGFLTLAAAVFGGLRGGCFTYAMTRQLLRIRSDLFRAVIRQEIGFFDEVKTGEITSRLTSDTTTMSNSISLNLNVFLRNFIMFVGSLIFMFNLSWQLTVVNFVALPLLTFFSEVYGKYYERLSESVQTSLADANIVADEVIGSMRTVRSFANEEGEAASYDQQLKGTLKLEIKRTLAYVGFAFSWEASDLVVLLSVLWYGGHLALANRIGKGTLIQFFFYQMQMGDNIAVMAQVYTGLMEAVGASRKVLALIDREPPFRCDEGDHKPSGEVAGKIEFKDVTFAYPTRQGHPVLENVSFTVQPGEVVALVGPSGGGKSTCIGLLEHFYRPASGRILLDGKSISEYDHKFLHRTVSLVGQEPVLYARTISKNITYALEEEEVGQEEVERVAKMANAHDFVSKLPDGYETQAGEKGVQLSGGQKQRVAIARALVRHPRVLLLDEATSALDAESEHLVQQAIYASLAGRTVILIAHRLSTVERANRIVVIDRGRIRQQGTHKQLVQVEGLYKTLVQRQLLGDALTPEERGGKASQDKPQSPNAITIHRHVSEELGRSPPGLPSHRSAGSVDT